ALMDAPKQGTGKGYLVSMAVIIATGQPSASPLSPSRNEEEWRKTIFSTLRGGRTHIVIDNIEDTLNSASLSSALTTPMVSDRVLGASDERSVPNRATWIATGNNLTVGADLMRRTYR